MRKLRSIVLAAFMSMIVGILASGFTQEAQTLVEVTPLVMGPSSPEVSAAADAKIDYSRHEVTTIAAPIQVPIRKSSEPPAASLEIDAPTTHVGASQPSRQVPSVDAVPAIVVTAPEPETRYVNVALAGGQSVVDQGRGPVLFPLGDGFPPYIAEHDMTGGWARFGTLRAGMKVNLSGLVTGSYTVGQIITVPKKSNTNELKAFTQMPKVMLQTCIPGTSQMIVVGLY